MEVGDDLPINPFEPPRASSYEEGEEARVVELPSELHCRVSGAPTWSDMQQALRAISGRHAGQRWLVRLVAAPGVAAVAWYSEPWVAWSMAAPFFAWLAYTEILHLRGYFSYRRDFARGTGAFTPTEWVLDAEGFHAVGAGVDLEDGDANGCAWSEFRSYHYSDRAVALVDADGEWTIFFRNMFPSDGVWLRFARWAAGTYEIQPELKIQLTFGNKPVQSPPLSDVSIATERARCCRSVRESWLLALAWLLCPVIVLTSTIASYRALRVGDLPAASSALAVSVALTVFAWHTIDTRLRRWLRGISVTDGGLFLAGSQWQALPWALLLRARICRHRPRGGLRQTDVFLRLRGGRRYEFHGLGPEAEAVAAALVLGTIEWESANCDTASAQQSAVER